MNSRCVITFYSTHHVLQSEKALKEKFFNINLIPVPRKISSNCGISLEIECTDKDEILKVLKDNNIEIESVHELEG
ncbi:MAG: DUF3343 domain-containing protein [bacterium]|nr:DUF3343 domain-containing protein [bacterium]